MGFLDIHLKLKTNRFRGFFANGGDGGEDDERMKLSLNRRIRPVSHGCQSVENRSFDSDESDLMVAKRKLFDDENELCLFGIFDAHIGGGVSKYVEAHLFDQKLSKPLMVKKSKDTLRKAHLNVKTEAEAEEIMVRMSSTAAIVINGKKLVMANMGDYRAVLSKAGKAHELREKPIFGVMLRRFRQKFRGQTKYSISSEVAVASHKIDKKTEFLILGNIGIWEVMKYQEAVDLIWHIENPQHAAACLVKEALARRSRNIISCLIIRFD